MKKFFAAAAAAVLMIAGISTAKAQSPSEQFGLGAIVGNGGAVTLTYALSPAFHLGTTFGLALNDGSNNILFGPYAKFIFKGSTEFKPFLWGQFLVNNFSPEGGNSQTTTSLNLGGGGEYFITPNFGVYTVLPVVQLGFGDNSTTTFGILTPSIGAEWFF